ncbi:MAG: TauD/TfdA family dioxygenase [Pyrinomonadaceae bacterium]|nr:TauD/TfdA family dioxygenase [Pyrinomonadaceae bacterium]
METQEQSRPKRISMARTERKAVSVSPQSLVKSSYVEPGQLLPLILEPVAADLNLANWSRKNQDFIGRELATHGAILFRGFELKSVGHFEEFATTICSQLFDEYGDLPREGVSGKVYGSTPYPADQAILFHNESSHMHRWPMKIWFYCVTAARQGGETPIVDCRKIYELLDPQIRTRFEQKQLMYVRNYTDGLGVGWQSFFQTTEKSAVEDYCRRAGIDFEWKKNNGLRTRQICRAVARHPQTGEMVFFNQVQLHHLSCVDSATRLSLCALFGEEDLPRNVYYGDGTPIEDSVIEEICALYWQTSVRFPWREGDVVMLDNMLTAHGRMPFVGPRKIVVAIGEIVESRAV